MSKSSSVPHQFQISVPMDEVVREIEALRKEISELRQLVAPRKEWYDLREVAALKGVPYGTLTGRPYLKPRGGEPDGIIGGRCKWRHNTVMRWLEETDEDLPEPNEGADHSDGEQPS